MSTTTVAPRTGRAWVLGDDLNTDLLAPGRYMKFGVGEIAKQPNVEGAGEDDRVVLRGSHPRF